MTKTGISTEQHIKNQIEWYQGVNNSIWRDDIDVLKRLLDDKLFILQLEELRKTEPISPDSEYIQVYLEEKIIDILKQIGANLSQEKERYSLNLLFLEHDYFPEFHFFGYEDDSYEFRLLSGKEYLKFHFEKNLFEAAGPLKFSDLVSPIWEGRDEFFRNDYADSFEVLIHDIINANIANIDLALYHCFDRIQQDIFKLDIPLKDELFIFSNEHDSEQKNIYCMKK